MLKSFKDAPLAKSRDNEDGGYYSYVEAWKYSDETQVSAENFLEKRLDENDLEDWLWQRKAFAAPIASPTRGKLEGGIRILFAQPKTTYRLAVPLRLARSSVLEALSLASTTYVSFQLPSGVNTMHTTPEGSSVEDCSRIGFVLRSPQKWECSTGGLSISHDFATGITTALSLGYSFVSTPEHPHPPAKVDAFVQKIKDCHSHWTHPLLLSSLFLTDHSQLTHEFINHTLSERVVLVEHSVGVTKAGRSHKTFLDFKDWEHANSQMLFEGDRMQRENARKLVETINDLSTWIIFSKRSPEWNIGCIKFLLQLLEGSNRLSNCRGIPAGTFRESLEFVRSYSETSAEVVQTNQDRVSLQLNILYTSIAQDDGQTSARLAASSGKDSTSMKIIALITAAYLPGTFVATLFSMNMFDWQAGRTVSPSFWIYWAVTIPLTIVTLTGWGLWWKFEKERFDREIQLAVHDKPTRKLFPDLRSH